MKVTETQTELIDGISPISDEPPIEFKIVNEHDNSAPTTTGSIINNNQSKLNLSNMTDLRCIDDDASSGRRVLFPPDNPETKL
jgi:hypothetical protein